MNRAERRRRERHERKVRDQRGSVSVGDSIVAASMGQVSEVTNPNRALPDKVPGEHRWIATGMWSVTVDDVKHVEDPDRAKFLDTENLVYLGLGCYDCEKVLGTEIEPGSRCEAAGS